MVDKVQRGGALETGLDVLECLASSPSGLGVSEIATRNGMDKGNTYRVLKTLISRGYAEQDEQSKRYRASAKLVSMAGEVLRRLDLRDAATDVCQELSERTGESTHVGQLISEGLVYVLERRALFRVSVDTEVGSRAPMHAAASGKAVLAYIDDKAKRDAWLTEPLQKFTMRTITDRDSLDRELSRIPELGYALDDEEYIPGVRCVAAPVFGLDGGVVGCIGVSAPTFRMDIVRSPGILDDVMTAARTITEKLGGPLDLYPGSQTDAEASGS